MGRDPKLGRGEHPDGSGIFYQNYLIFCILDEPQLIPLLRYCFQIFTGVKVKMHLSSVLMDIHKIILTLKQSYQDFFLHVIPFINLKI
jgi:hypothetical protein